MLEISIDMRKTNAYNKSVNCLRIYQLGYKCRASSAKVGGGGIRYTVRINGRETYLFQEGSRWFVEARA